MSSPWKRDVIKHTPGRGGKPPQFYAITDAEIALAMMRELDELRAAARSGRGER